MFGFVSLPAILAMLTTDPQPRRTLPGVHARIKSIVPTTAEPPHSPAFAFTVAVAEHE